MVQQVLEKHCDIANVGQGLAVFPVADHQEFPGSDLLQQVKHVAPVVLPEDHAGPHDHQFALVRSLLPPRPQNLFSFPLALAVVTERMDLIGLLRSVPVESVHRHRAGEDEPPHVMLAHRLHNVPCALHVHVVVQGNRRHVILMLGGEQNHRLGSGQLFRKRLRLPDIAGMHLIRERRARLLVKEVELPDRKELGEVGADEAGTSDQEVHATRLW